MASVNQTLVEKPQTIESDGTARVLTKGLAGMRGVLVNGGNNSAWVLVNAPGVLADGVTAVTTVPVTNAAGDGYAELPAGASMPVCKHYTTIEHKSTAGTVLFWFPDSGYGRN